jgi:hypothetical protein
VFNSASRHWMAHASRAEVRTLLVSVVGILGLEEMEKLGIVQGSLAMLWLADSQLASLLHD